MNIADYILFGLFAAVILFGIYKGFVGMLIDLASNIVAFFAAVLLARTAAGYLENLWIFNGMKSRIQEYFTNNADLASKSVAQAVDGILIPPFVKDFILKGVPDASQSLNAGAAALADRIFHLMFLTVVCLAIFILVRVAFCFLETFIERIFKKVKLLQAIDKILGAAFGIADAVLIAYVLLAILTLLSSRMPAIAAVVSESAIASKLFYNNLLLMILT